MLTSMIMSLLSTSSSVTEIYTTSFTAHPDFKASYQKILSGHRSQGEPQIRQVKVVGDDNELMETYIYTEGLSMQDNLKTGLVLKVETEAIILECGSRKMSKLEAKYCKTGEDQATLYRQVKVTELTL